MLKSSLYLWSSTCIQTHTLLPVQGRSSSEVACWSTARSFWQEERQASNQETWIKGGQVHVLREKQHESILTQGRESTMHPTTLIIEFHGDSRQVLLEVVC